MHRQAATLWAAYLFNTRHAANGKSSSSSYVPELATAAYMQDCDVMLDVTVWDMGLEGKGNTQEGAIESYRAAYVTASPLDQADAFTLDIYSSRTKTLSFLGALDQVPMTSGSSTSDELDITAT